MKTSDRMNKNQFKKVTLLPSGALMECYSIFCTLRRIMTRKESPLVLRSKGTLLYQRLKMKVMILVHSIKISDGKMKLYISFFFRRITMI